MGGLLGRRVTNVVLCTRDSNRYCGVDLFVRPMVGYNLPEDGCVHYGWVDKSTRAVGDRKDVL